MYGVTEDAIYRTHLVRWPEEVSVDGACSVKQWLTVVCDHSLNNLNGTEQHSGQI